MVVSDRPQERLERHGAEALSDREILAMILRSGPKATEFQDTAGVLAAIGAVHILTLLGANQAQLESTVRNLANVAENTSAAAGRIMDTDYAAETANLTKAQILQQAATSILAQANAQPQSVLSLLQ